MVARRPVLLYDHDCGFCRWCVAWVLRRDPEARVAIDSIKSAEGTVLLSGMEEERRLKSWHVVLADGRILSGGAALAPLFDALGRFGFVAALARRLPRATDAAYRFVASHRRCMGKLLSRRAIAAADEIIEAHRRRQARADP